MCENVTIFSVVDLSTLIFLGNILKVFTETFFSMKLNIQKKVLYEVLILFFNYVRQQIFRHWSLDHNNAVVRNSNDVRLFKKKKKPIAVTVI